MLYTVELYCSSTGRVIFREWVESLSDFNAVAIIHKRIDRVQMGSFGKIGALKAGLWELKIDYGPGYRVYYAYAGKTAILVLCGGTKRTQDRDIAMARKYWADYNDQGVER